MSDTSFKVVIVGAGPAGLTLAHAFALANIDFVVLERRDTISMDAGASLVLAPASLRVMEQFGLLKRLLAMGVEILSNKSLNSQGKQLSHSAAVQQLRHNHGIAPVAFHRADLVDAIHDELSPISKAKVLTRKRIIEITNEDDGVKVNCDDGSSFTGDIVVGADGVHSQVRSIMRSQALANGHHDAASWDSETPYTSEYRCLWCSFDYPNQDGKAYDTQDRDKSVMYLGGATRSWMFLYEKLPAKTNARTSYTKEDIEDMISRFADYPVTDHLKVKECYNKRFTAGMSNLEEGIIKYWHLKRLVLVGDACHKFTPNAGLGFNNGVQDVVALANAINTAVQKSVTGNLTVSEVNTAFEHYQSLRRKDVEGQLSQSSVTTRMQAWSSPLYYVLARILGKEFFQSMLINYLASPQISKSLVLEYGPVPTAFRGAIPWAQTGRLIGTLV